MNKPTERTLFPLPESARPEPQVRVKDTLTYTAASTFQTCRRKFLHRYVNGLVPVVKQHALAFGSVTHQWLEVWHRTRSQVEAQSVIDAAYVNRGSDRDERHAWHYQTAMLKGYAAQYAAEDFEIVALEKEFAGPLRNPAPGGLPSRSFVFRGKVDGILRRGDSFILFESKTAGTLTGDYIERLGLDMQILSYAHFVREVLQYPVTSIIYNVLVKPRLVQAEGETEEQYSQRKAALEAASKTGKPSSAKRKLPETDDEFQARLADWFAAEPRFTRIELILDFDAVENVRRTLWGISKEILAARKSDGWHQSPKACVSFGRCPYFELCVSKDNPAVIENLYRREPPHSELEEKAEEAF